MWNRQKDFINDLTTGIHDDTELLASATTSELKWTQLLAALNKRQLHQVKK